jgi:uncharacterized protein
MPSGIEIATKLSVSDGIFQSRNKRFGRSPDYAQNRWWLNKNPYATALFNAMSYSFPKGEAFFVEAVKAHSEGAPPKLAAEIRAFTIQEVTHSREHIAFNKRIAGAGYDLAPLERYVDDMVELAHQRAPIKNLAATVAFEHLTAIFARRILRDPRFLHGAEREAAALWRWHAIEEVEHKAVAYDTWLHATQDWSGFRRWRLRSWMMALILKDLVPHRIGRSLELLKQDGVTGFGARLNMLWLVFGNPGIFRVTMGDLLSFFLPGFHPAKHDDSALLSQYDSEGLLAEID